MQHARCKAKANDSIVSEILIKKRGRLKQAALFYAVDNYFLP